jgi:hypothetical protein
MRQKLSFLTRLGIVLALSIAFAACGETIQLSSSAELGSLTVAGKAVTLGTPSANWLTAKEAANTASVYLSASAMANAEVVFTKGQEGQTVYLAAAKPDVMPDFLEGTSTFTFEALDYLWVEVFSENHDTFNIYAVQVRTSTPTVLDISYGTRSATGGLLPNGQPIQQYGTGIGTPGATIAAAVEGEVWFGDNQTATPLALVVDTEDPATTVLAAIGAAGASESTLFPEAYTNPNPLQFTPVNNNYLYLKAVSGDAEGETVYYKIKLVQKTTDLTIGGVTIQGNSATPVSFGVGTMGTNGFGGGENHGNGAQLAATNSFKNILDADASSASSVTVAIGTAPAGAAIRYGHTDFFNAQEDVPSEGHITLTYQTSNVLANVGAGEYIAVEVTNGLGDKGWYAFRVAIGRNSDITDLTVEGNSITLNDAKNTSAAGTAFDTWRPGSEPTNANSDAFWDSIAIAATGSSSPAEILVAAADTVGAAIAEEAWITAASGNHTFANVLSTGKFVIIRVKNQDTLDYYYKVQVAYGSSDAELTGVTVGGVTATIGTPGNEVAGGFGSNITGYTAGAVTLTTAEATPPAGVAVAISGLSADATAEYGLGMAFWGSLMPPWGPPFGLGWLSSGAGLFSAPGTAINGAYILVRVTSEDRTVQQVYVIVATVSG